MRVVLNKTLSNSAQVKAAVYSECRSFIVCLRFKFGRLLEKDSEVGFTHLAEHVLLNSKALAKLQSEFVSAGGKVSGAVTQIDTTFVFKAPIENKDLLLKYLFEFSNFKTFADVDVKNELKVISKESISQSYDRKISFHTFDGLIKTRKLPKFFNPTAKSLVGFTRRNFCGSNLSIGVVSQGFSKKDFEMLESIGKGYKKGSKSKPLKLSVQKSPEPTYLKSPKGSAYEVKATFPIKSDNTFGAECLAKYLDFVIKRRFKDTTGKTYVCGSSHTNLGQYQLIEIYTSSSDTKIFGEVFNFAIEKIKNCTQSDFDGIKRVVLSHRVYEEEKPVNLAILLTQDNKTEKTSYSEFYKICKSFTSTKFKITYSGPHPIKI